MSAESLSIRLPLANRDIYAPSATIEMTFTGQLGIQISQLGQIELGLGASLAPPVPSPGAPRVIFTAAMLDLAIRFDARLGQVITFDARLG